MSVDTRALYASYIGAILGMSHRIPHTMRVPIETISAPSIFHAEAIRNHNRSAFLSFLLTRKVAELK